LAGVATARRPFGTLRSPARLDQGWHMDCSRVLRVIVWSLIMSTSHRYLKPSLLAAAVAVPVLAAAAPSHAEVKALPTCDSEQEEVSASWLYAIADCGLDHAIENGDSSIDEFAKSLIAGAIDYYVPGLSKVFLGGRETDPLVEQIQRVLDSIDNAKADIISAIVDNERDKQMNVTWPQIREDMETFSMYSPSQRMGHYNGGFYGIFANEMQSLRTNIVNRDDIFGIDAVHTLMALTSLNLQAAPEIDYLAEVSGENLSLDELADLAPQDVATFDANVREAVLTDMHEILTGQSGTLRYLEWLASNNKYKYYVNKSFAPVDYSNCATNFLIHNTQGNDCTVKFKFTDQVNEFDKDANKHVSKAEETTRYIMLTCEASHYIPATPKMAATTWCDKIRTSTTLPDGSTLERTSNYPCDAQNEDCSVKQIDKSDVEALLQEHKDFQYRQVVLSVYGPMRPVIDSWYNLMNQSPPEFQVDKDLEGFVMAPACTIKVSAGSPFNPLPVITQTCQGGDLELTQLIQSSRDQRAPTVLDRRSIVNYVMLNGWKALTRMRFSAYANDAMAAATGGPPSADYYRALEDGRDPNTYASYFQGIFASKVITVLR
jgi:hypothetical protein